MKFHINKQAGISLLLSVLILAAITAVTFSLVTIVLVEIRASGDVLRTEPALYAALGVSEEAMFEYKRYVNERQDENTYPPPNPKTIDIANCAPVSQTSLCQLGNVAINMPGSQPLEFDDSPRVISVGAGETLTIPLYYINDFNVLYNEINIDLIPNDNLGDLNVHLVKNPIDDTDATTVNATTIMVDDNPLDVVSYNTGMVDDNQYDLVLTNGTSESFLVNISSTASAAASQYGYTEDDPMGLPYVGQKVLRMVADYLGQTRTYRVNIPVP